MGASNLNMNGHQRTTGKGGTLTSFLIHHLNQRMRRSRLVCEQLCFSVPQEPSFISFHYGGFPSW